jgi:hypothetical protein
MGVPIVGRVVWCGWVVVEILQDKLPH